MAISSFSLMADETKKKSAYDAFVESASQKSFSGNDSNSSKTKKESHNLSNEDTKKVVDDSSDKANNNSNVDSKNSAFDAFVKSASQKKW